MTNESANNKPRSAFNADPERAPDILRIPKMAYASATPRSEFHINTSWLRSLVDSAKLRIERQRAYRRTYDELSIMTERELADINLSSLDISDVAREAAARIH